MIHSDLRGRSIHVAYNSLHIFPPPLILIPDPNLKLCTEILQVAPRMHPRGHRLARSVRFTDSLIELVKRMGTSVLYVVVFPSVR
jgi:hypothetical protein